MRRISRTSTATPSNQGILVLRNRRQPKRRASMFLSALMVIVPIVAARSAGAADARAAPNVCATMGVTDAIAAKYLGAGAYAKYGAGYCRLLPVANENGLDSVGISLSPATQFKEEARDSDDPERLTKLGPGAVWFPNGSLVFRVGAHAVFIAGSNGLLLSKSMLTALAHVIYAHLS